MPRSQVNDRSSSSGIEVIVAVGWFEVRVDGPARHHYRLFCKLDYTAQGVDKPLLVVIAGRDKPFHTDLAARDYRGVNRPGVSGDFLA